MISKEYEKYLRSAAWSDKRTARLRIDHGRCAICGSGQDLNVHHLTYRNIMKEDVQQDLVTLCRPCHAMLHRIQEQSMDLFQEYKAEKDQRIREARKRDMMKLLFRLIIVEIWQRDLTAGGDVRIFDSGKQMIGKLTQILKLIYPELRQDLWRLNDEIKDTLGVFRSALVVQDYRSGSSLNEVADHFGMKASNVQKILKRHGFNYAARIK